MLYVSVKLSKDKINPFVDLMRENKDLFFAGNPTHLDDGGIIYYVAGEDATAFFQLGVMWGLKLEGLIKEGFYKSKSMEVPE